jgi:hypothetical protein
MKKEAQWRVEQESKEKQPNGRKIKMGRTQDEIMKDLGILLERSRGANLETHISVVWMEEQKVYYVNIPY